MTHPNAAKYGFTVTSSGVVHENPYYKIQKYGVTLPNGAEQPFWVFEGPQFSVTIPLFPDGTTLLVGQYRVHADFYSWEFPMGNTIVTEPLVNAKEELKEETGYSAKHWKQIGSYFVGPGRLNTKVHIFIAENLTEGKAHPESTEFITTKRVTISDVGKMIESGIIMDGPTIVAFHFLQTYLHK